MFLSNQYISQAIREIYMKVGSQVDDKKTTDEVALMKKLHHPNAIKLHEVMYSSHSSTWYLGNGQPKSQ